MTTLLTVFAAVIAVFLATVLIAPTVVNLPRFLGRFRLECPHSHVFGEVKLNRFGAALTSAYGILRLRVRRCTLLAPGEKCDEGCVTRWES